MGARARAPAAPPFHPLAVALSLPFSLSLSLNQASTLKEKRSTKSGSAMDFAFEFCTTLK